MIVFAFLFLQSFSKLHALKIASFSRNNFQALLRELIFGNCVVSQGLQNMFEVIACSVADAVAAEQGGADRLELIADFAVGGLTPPFALVREVITAVKIPVRVMLRETENFTVTDDAEKQRLCEAAKKLAALPIDGIVCGFLRGDAIDQSLLTRILAIAPQLKFTFHRAFEELSNPIQSLNQLKYYPQIDYILTSGGQGSQGQKIQNLKNYELAARPEIKILAGGGMTDEMIRAIKENTAIRDFHLGTFVREPQEVNGKVAVRRVKAMSELIEM